MTGWRLADNGRFWGISHEGVVGFFPPSELDSSDSGFDNRTDSTISFDDGTRTFTIAPAVASYSFISDNNKYTKTTSLSIQIDDTEGLWFFYFDSDGNLVATQTFSDDIILKYAFVALVYWDADNNTAITVAEERHGNVMDSATHLYNHNTVGTQYGSGLQPTDVVADGSGNDATHAQIGLSSGTIWDEDIKISIPSYTAPASFPFLYKSGANGYWRKIAANDYIVTTTGTGRAAYNEWTGATWQLTEVGNAKFCLMHLYATNDIDTPMVWILGENEYNSATDARDGATNELLQLETDGLPVVEYKAIATFIIQSATSYSNAVKSKVISTGTGADYIDFRFLDSGINLSVAGVTSSALGDLNDVTLSSLLDGNLLKYDSGSGQWINFAADYAGITSGDITNWNTAYGWGDWETGVTKAFVDALNVDADTLDGAQPNTGASNSTIVKRTSLGYIYANYFNTTPNTVTSGVTQVCVETGNDGFIRHGTAAAIASFISGQSFNINGTSLSNVSNISTTECPAGGWYGITWEDNYWRYRSTGTAGVAGIRFDYNDTVMQQFDSNGGVYFFGTLSMGDGSQPSSKIEIKKSDNDISDHISFYNNTTRVGEIGVEDTAWLRINQETATNIYTPRMIRADGGFNVDNVQVISADGKTFILGSGGPELTHAGVSSQLYVKNAVVSGNFSYAANQDAAYMVAAPFSNYTGASTNWGTYGLQHRFKSDAGAVPRLTIDSNTGEQFSVDNNGVVTMPAVYSDTVTGRDLYISSTGQLGYVSSVREAKTNFAKFDSTFIYDLSPVSFNYRKTESDFEGNITYLDEWEEELEYGLIADEVEAVNKELVFYDGDKLAGVSYKKLIVPLVQEVQKLRKELEEMKNAKV